MAGVCLTFKETVKMFSTVIAQFYIPPAVYEISCPSTSLVLSDLGFSHSSGHLAIISTSLMITDVENLFMPLFVTHISF